jgi:hypothetical protein
LAVGVLGKADRAGLSDPFQSRSDVDAVAHEVAVGLLDHVAQMNADPEFYAALRRQAGVALDKAVLHFDRAAHRVDPAAELDEAAVAGALDHATTMHGDGRIDEVAAQRPEPRQDAILVRSREPAISDDICDQNRRDLPGLADGAPSGPIQRSTETGPEPAWLSVASEPKGGRPSQYSKGGLGVDRRAMTSICPEATSHVDVERT